MAPTNRPYSDRTDTVFIQSNRFEVNFCLNFTVIKYVEKVKYFFFRFNISDSSVDVANYLHEISNIFISKVFKECGDDCDEARSEKHVSVRLSVHSNETEITWNTDESYRLDVVTSGWYYEFNTRFFSCYFHSIIQ